MPKLKTRKLIAKRFKQSKSRKSKKITHRACGQDHFNARATGKQTRHKRLRRTAPKKISKLVRQHN